MKKQPSSKNRPVFHLAIPVLDVTSTIQFYKGKLKLPIDLIEDRRCIINFYGHQVVAHVSEKDVPKEVQMYPRHFGIIFDEERHFDTLLKNALESSVSFFQEHFERFKDTPRAHRTFFLKDPSNNLLEFKWYRNPELIYSSDKS